MSRHFLMIVVYSLTVAWASSAEELYVSPTGDDTAPGTKEQPVRTLEAARNLIRKRGIQKPSTVFLRGGVHIRQTAFLLTETDSSPDPKLSIAYRAYPGETPVLQLGRVIAPAEAKPVIDADVRNRIPAEARDKVVEIDGKALGLTHLGPWPDLVKENGGIVELLFDGTRLPLAQWPNDAPTTMGKVLDNGEEKAPNRHGGTFEYRDARHTTWPIERGVWLTGYWRVPWQLETLRVQSINATTKTITFAQPVAGGIGSKFARPNGSGKEPYRVVNQLEELDRPGEWCLDFPTGKIYLWPPAELKPGSLVICDKAEPIITCTNVARVTFDKLHCAGGLGNAIEINGGRFVSVVGCDLHGFGKSGVVVKGGEDHRVEGCELSHLGDSGILLEGGNRRELTPCRHLAIHNHIHHYGEVKKVYSAGVQVGSAPLVTVGAVVQNNRIHDSPHAGILYGGNDNLIERNDIFRVCQISEDMGGIYTWHDWTSHGNIVRHNFIHDSPLAHGVYLDDGDSGDTVIGNVFSKIDVGVFVGGGHDNIVTGNLAVDCKVGVHIDARGVTRGYNAQSKPMVDRLRSAKPDQAPWKDRFPTLATLLDEHPELPTGVIFADNLFVRCGKGVDRKAKPDELRFVTFGTNLEVTTDPGFVAPGFGLKADASVYTKLPGFRPIPFEKIGPTR